MCNSFQFVKKYSILGKLPQVTYLAVITQFIFRYCLQKLQKHRERTPFYGKERTQGFKNSLIYKISQKSNNLEGSNGVEPDHSNGDLGGGRTDLIQNSLWYALTK